jgi:NUDIX domain
MAFSFDASQFWRALVARRRQYCGTTRGFEGNLSESAATKYTPSNTLLGLFPSLMNQWNLIAVPASNPSEQGGKVFPMLNAKQQSAWERHSKEMNKSLAQASVLVILCSTSTIGQRGGSEPIQELSILFTVRASSLNSHASEISFPGGHVEPEETAVEAAVRETQEELIPALPGLFECQNEEEDETTASRPPRLPLTIVGQASPIPSLRGTPVTPVIAVWWPNLLENQSYPIHQLFPGNPDEVSLVFTVPVRTLLETEGSLQLPKNRFGYTSSPCYPLPSSVLQEISKKKKTHIHGTDSRDEKDDNSPPVIWGLTAYILRPLLRKWLAPALGFKSANNSHVNP